MDCKAQNNYRLIDKGPVNQPIEDVQLTISTADISLTKTQICNDGKDIGTGSGNNTGGNGGGTTTGKPVVSQTGIDSGT